MEPLPGVARTVQPSQAGSLLFLTGPLGAGKSTTALAWATKGPSLRALIGHNQVRYFIKAGFADPAVCWDAAAQRQWELARTICCDLARRYVAAGSDCVIDAFSPVNDFARWWDSLAGIRMRVAVLLPTVETTIARNRQRNGPARLREESVRENHAWMAEWKSVPSAFIIDNSDLSVAEVIHQVERWQHPFSWMPTALNG